MARTIQEIYDAIAAEKSSMSSLNALQPGVDSAQDLLSDVASPSKVADWRLWIWLVAVVVHLFERSMDIFTAEIDEKVLATKSHSLPWYQLRALAFQYGHALAFNTELEKYEYLVDDEAARIVAKASTEELNSYVLVKVTKEAGILTTGELVAFKAYMDNVKDAGTPIFAISEPADQFKITADIYYDPQVLAPNGSLLSDGAVFPVIDQLEAYKESIGFNGLLEKTKMVDYMQKAEGILNPVLRVLEAKSHTDPYQIVDVYYKPYSGHYALDTGAFIIQYLPYV